MVLANRLTLAPPSLRHLIGMLEQSEVYQEFLLLVREFLPEHEREIITSRSRLDAFARRFEERYFPLAEAVVDDEEMEFLVSSIPIVLEGMSFDDYHEFEHYNQAQQLLMALVEYSFWGEEEGGARVPLLEQCAKYVGEDLIRRVPRLGWKPEHMHQRLDGTEFEGAAVFADYMWHQTGTIFLDCTYDEDWGGDLGWSRENVEGLTEEWPRARQMEAQMSSIMDWLDDAPQINFEKLLDALGELPEPIPKEQMALPLEPQTLIEVFRDEEPEEFTEV